MAWVHESCLADERPDDSGLWVEVMPVPSSQPLTREQHVSLRFLFDWAHEHGYPDDALDPLWDSLAATPSTQPVEDEVEPMGTSEGLGVKPGGFFSRRMAESRPPSGQGGPEERVAEALRPIISSYAVAKGPTPGWLTDVSETLARAALAVLADGAGEGEQDAAH